MQTRATWFADLDAAMGYLALARDFPKQSGDYVEPAHRPWCDALAQWSEQVEEVRLHGARRVETPEPGDLARLEHKITGEQIVTIVTMVGTPSRHRGRRQRPKVYIARGGKGASYTSKPVKEFDSNQSITFHTLGFE